MMLLMIHGHALLKKIDYATARKKHNTCITRAHILHICMGIKHLNKFIRTECYDAIKPIGLHDLTGKAIVVDASIFMYRFIGENALLENMYTMMSIFQKHNITSLFVFDGKPPEEKQNTVNKRRRMKRIAEMQYNRIVRDMRQAQAQAQAQVQAQAQAQAQADEQEKMLKNLRRRFIRIKDDDIERVKTLMRALGVQYIVSDGEADILCAQMVIKRQAYACVSDDTDLFVHGCPRVLQDINLYNQTAVLYEMPKILNVLGINMTEFRQICVISGTDYHSGPMHGMNLKVAVSLFGQYKACKKTAEESGDVFAPDFYTWLHHTCKHFDYDKTMAVYNMFQTTMPKCLPEISLSAQKRDNELLHQVMAHENFIFIK